MISNRQVLAQKQTLQQKLSPQQIQYIKLLQLPLTGLEQRIKDEMEGNPLLEVSDGTSEPATDSQDHAEEPSVADSADVDWEHLYPRDEFDAYKTGRNTAASDYREIPRPYHESVIESLEKQVILLPISEKEHMIADQILGSLDPDGYFRRPLTSVADSIAFNHGIPVSEKEVERVLRQIQQLDPPGIAARDLRECLMLQLEALPEQTRGRQCALRMLKQEWELFEKKHFDRIAAKLNLSQDQVREAYACIQSLDPKPGGSPETQIDTAVIMPDFSAWMLREADQAGDADAVIDGVAIVMHRQNRPRIHISDRYRRLLEQVKASGATAKDIKETESFLKSKLDAAKWFIDALEQRGNTLLLVMKAIVEQQMAFFRTGTGLKPMILKDIADSVEMDISTISRIVNGKFVQTPFGTFELKYFFNEGLETGDGEEVTNREVQEALAQVIRDEDKTQPLSDQALADKLKEMGYPVARRTVTKYREALGLPVARMRKEVI